MPLPIGVSDTIHLVLIYNAGGVEPPFEHTIVAVGFDQTAPLFWAPIAEDTGLRHLHQKAVLEILTAPRFEIDYRRPAPAINTVEAYNVTFKPSMRLTLLKNYPRKVQQRYVARLRDPRRVPPWNVEGKEPSDEF